MQSFHPHNFQSDRKPRSFSCILQKILFVLNYAELLIQVSQTNKRIPIILTLHSCLILSLCLRVIILSGYLVCSSTYPSRVPSKWASKMREWRAVVKHLSYQSKKKFNLLLLNILTIILPNASINHLASTVIYLLWCSCIEFNMASELLRATGVDRLFVLDGIIKKGIYHQADI